MVFMSRKRIKDLLLRVRVVVRTSNMEIPRRHLSNYVKELHWKACRRSSTTIFFPFTNHIIHLWCRRFLNPLLMYLHSAELSLSGSDKKCKYFLFGMTHSCSLLCLAYLRFGSCNVIHLSSGTVNFYFKDSFMFEGPIILYLPLAPKGCCVCIWLGDTFPFFPVDWFLVYVPGGCAVLIA